MVRERKELWPCCAFAADAACHVSCTTDYIATLNCSYSGSEKALSYEIQANCRYQLILFFHRVLFVLWLYTYINSLQTVNTVYYATMMLLMPMNFFLSRLVLSKCIPACDESANCLPCLVISHHIVLSSFQRYDGLHSWEMCHQITKSVVYHAARQLFHDSKPWYLLWTQRKTHQPTNQQGRVRFKGCASEPDEYVSGVILFLTHDSTQMSFS